MQLRPVLSPRRVLQRPRTPIHIIIHIHMHIRIRIRIHNPEEFCSGKILKLPNNQREVRPTTHFMGIRLVTRVECVIIINSSM